MAGPFTKLPPISPRDVFANSPVFHRWLERVYLILGSVPGIEWEVLSKSGSNLTDIETRNHNDLQTRDAADAHPWDSVTKTGSELQDIVTRPHSQLQTILQADDTSASTDGEKHVTDALVKKYNDHILIVDANPHGTDHSQLDNVLGGSDEHHVMETERSELTALDALAAGMVAKTADAAYANRTLTGTANEIDIANGDGVSGNPTFTLPERIDGPRKFGTATNYSEFEADGTLRAYGDATAFQDINFDIGALAQGASAPTFAALSGGTIEHPHFLNSRTTAINGALEIDHEVRLVTISPHFHWVATTTGTGDVKMSLTYTITNGGDTEPTETTISVTDTADGTLNKNYSVAFPDIDVSSHSVGCQFSFRFFRDPADAADTLAADIALKTFGLHVEVQSLGTRTVIND